MSRSLCWLSDGAWAAIGPHLPKNQPGALRVDDRRVISGTVHNLKCGCRWQGCLSEYGPSTFCRIKGFRHVATHYASLHATTSPPSRSLLPSPSGYERVWTLVMRTKLVGISIISC